MIEEAGRVVEVRDEFAWIETTPMTACNSCSARSGCGTPVLAKVLGRRNSPLRVANRIGVVVGDRVVIGIAESGLVRGSFAVYFAPLGGLFLGAAAGYYLAGSSGYAEPASILGALTGFLAGLAWVRRFSRRTRQDARYQPVLLRQLIATVD